MARLLSAAAYLTHDPALRAIALVARLAAVAEAVADLRRAQQHAAQAAAAKTAAERLRSAAGVRTVTQSNGPAQAPAPAAAGLAQLAFPGPPDPGRPRRPAPGTRAASWPGARPRRGPPPPPAPRGRRR